MLNFWLEVETCICYIYILQTCQHKSYPTNYIHYWPSHSKAQDLSMSILCSSHFSTYFLMQQTFNQQGIWILLFIINCVGSGMWQKQLQ